MPRTTRFTAARPHYRNLPREGSDEDLARALCETAGYARLRLFYMRTAAFSTLTTLRLIVMRNSVVSLKCFANAFAARRSATVSRDTSCRPISIGRDVGAVAASNPLELTFEGTGRGERVVACRGLEILRGIACGIGGNGLEQVRRLRLVHVVARPRRCRRRLMRALISSIRTIFSMWVTNMSSTWLRMMAVRTAVWGESVEALLDGALDDAHRREVLR